MLNQINRKKYDHIYVQYRLIKKIIIQRKDDIGFKFAFHIYLFSLECLQFGCINLIADIIRLISEHPFTGRKHIEFQIHFHYILIKLRRLMRYFTMVSNMDISEDIKMNTKKRQRDDDIKVQNKK